jgi:putative oxidoreductase
MLISTRLLNADWLIRIPLAIVFLQQGMYKLPFNPEDAASFDLPVLVWAFVVAGEIGAGLGLICGGLIQKLWSRIADVVTRFSGFTMGCIATGVIWVSQPESLVDVLLYDNLHVFLWAGGLFFAMKGNSK